jgi:DNA polymerase-4
MILHVDMDAFYASVEQRERPELKSKPVIVGGSASGRGVVSAANYEARRYGVHSAMPTSRALRLCPHAVLLKTRMGFYAEVSKQIRQIFLRYTPQVEPLSLDEAFLDVSGCEQLFGSAETIGRSIKLAILDELSLVASVGVAPNKFLAKLASDLEKPDGFTVVPGDRILQTLAPLPVSRLWGVGKATERKFHQARIATFGDLQALSVQHAQQLFGSAGEHFWKLAHGIDHRTVVADREAKTISHEHTFPVDIDDLEILLSWLLELTEQVTTRLRAHRKLGRTVHLKVRYSDFHTITRSRSIPMATDSTDAVWQVASDLLQRELPDRRLQVRLIGMGVSNLEWTGIRQLELFDDMGAGAASRSLDNTTDTIRKQFGRGALRRASTLRPRKPPSSGSP